MNNILLGAIAMAAMVASLFFLRYWKSTGDRFFLFFSLSFALESLNRIFLAPTSASQDAPDYYLVRLLSYVLILVAIWDKNRRRQENP